MPLATVPTARLILFASAMGVASAVIAWLRKLATREGAPSAAAALEYLGMGLFGFTYVALWLLLVLGPLRPKTVFTTHGNAGDRFFNFLAALGALALLHLWLAFSVATAGR